MTDWTPAVVDLLLRVAGATRVVTGQGRGRIFHNSSSVDAQSRDARGSLFLRRGRAGQRKKMSGLGGAASLENFQGRSSHFPWGRGRAGHASPAQFCSMMH